MPSDVPEELSDDWCHDCDRLLSECPDECRACKSCNGDGWHYCGVCYGEGAFSGGAHRWVCDRCKGTGRVACVRCATPPDIEFLNKE